MAVLVAGCTIHSRTHSALDRVTGAARRSVCILFFDGLSSDALDRMLESGAVPNLKREIVDRGLVVDNAVASVPSETYPNLSALLTGLLPGHHGIPANVWLDRRRRIREAHTNIFRSYAASDFLLPEARTIYERLPADTVAITTPVARGATVYSKNLIAVMAAYDRNDWDFLDRKTLDDVGDAYAGAVTAGKLPSLVFGHLLGTDEIAHSDGPDSAEFRATMSAIDQAFARLVRRLRRRKIFDQILFVIVGDHGNAPYTTYVDPRELVNRALVAHPTQADCTTENCVLVPLSRHFGGTFDVGDAEISVGAYRGIMIWLPATREVADIPTVFRTRKKSRKRKKAVIAAPSRMPPASDFANALAHTPEIQLVVTRGQEPGTVNIYRASGRSQIVREDSDSGPSRFAYRVLEGADPLRYDVTLGPAVLGQLLSAEEWLSRTAETEYPDLVVQLAEFFDSPRAPDVFLSPRPGFGFTDKKAGGHGSLSRLETVVPLVFAGPGVLPGHRRAARTVDLMPTLLGYLGVGFDADELDGDDLHISSETSSGPPSIPVARETADGPDADPGNGRRKY